MKLHIAFSGGETSGFMTNWLLKHKANDYDEIKVVFANTGQENEETLEFVNRCDKELGFKVVWIEAQVNEGKRKGTTFKVVDFETASRDGGPFEAAIKKYGIPNNTWKICTRELKTTPVRAYLRAIGWRKKDYVSAIGIRADEVHRVSSNMSKDRIVYPLIEWVPMDKPSIKRWWRKQDFHLGLMEHQGNCKWCWKKSKRKLLTLAQDSPEIFDFPMRMEELYGDVGHANERRVFFRNYMSTKELLEEAKKPFVRFDGAKENLYLFDDDLDSPGGCSESCDAF